MKTPLQTDKMDKWPKDGIEHIGKCPVCGSQAYSIIHEELIDDLCRSPLGPWNLQSCNLCDSAFLDPRPTKGSIYIAYKNYYTHGDSNSKKIDTTQGSSKLINLNINHFDIKKSSNRSFRQLLKSFFIIFPIIGSSIANSNRHLPRASLGNDNLLDIGCGDGRFMHLAKQLGWNVEGIDPDEQAVAVCIRDGLDAKVGQIDEILSESKLYDVVTCCHVIEHIHDPNEFVRLVTTKIRVGGTFWLETPNIRSLGHLHFKNNWCGLEPPRHLVIFNVASLKNMLNFHGYDVEQTAWNFRQLYNVYKQSDMLNSSGKKSLIVAKVIYFLRILLASLKSCVKADVREFITLKCVKR